MILNIIINLKKKSDKKKDKEKKDIKINNIRYI